MAATIRVSGDVKQALAALELLGLKAEETGAKAEAAFGDRLAGATSKVSGLFTGMLSNLPVVGEGFRKMGEKIAEADTKGEKFRASMQAVGGALTLGLGAGFAAVAAESVKMAGNFQSASEHLVTDAGESQSALKGVEQGMLAISSATGTSSEKITEGMYHIESAGYHGAAGLQILKTAAEGAKVGGADLDTVAQTLTGTMRAYNIPASQAVSTMNQLITTVGSGDMRMQDLASSLGSVAPIAAAAHVSLAQVGGAVATMTAQNMSAQQATQDLANSIRSLQSPNQVAINEMAQFGINSNEVSQQLGQKGLTGTLQELTTAIASKMGPSGQIFLSTMNQSVGAAKDMQIEIKAMPKDLQALAEKFQSGSMTVKDYRTAIKALPADQQAMASGFISTYNQAHKFNSLLTSGSPAAQTYTAALSKMMGGATGLNTALMLTGGNAAEFQNNVNAISDSARHAGKNVDNWGAIQKTFNQQMDVAKTTVENLGIKLGLVLIPILEKVASAVAQVIDWFSRHKAVAEAVGIAIGILVAGPIAMYIGSMMMAAAASIAAAAPIYGIIVAAAALGAGIYELATHWGQVWGEVKSLADDAWKFIKGIFADGVNFVKSHWQDMLEGLLIVVTGGMAAIPVLILRYWNQISGFTASLWHDVSGFFTGMWHDVTNTVAAGVADVSGFFQRLPGDIMGDLGGLLGDLVTFGEHIIGAIVQGIGNMGSSIFDAIKSHIPGSGIIGQALNVVGLAEGGIVTKPTLAVVGEAGYPEAVIPLKNGIGVMGGPGAGVAPLPGSMSQPGQTAAPAGMPGSVTNINVMAQTNADPHQIAAEIGWAMR